MSNHGEVIVTSEDQQCDRDCSFQSWFWCFQLEIEVLLRSNWAKFLTGISPVLGQILRLFMAEDLLGQKALVAF